MVDAIVDDDDDDIDEDMWDYRKLFLDFSISYLEVFRDACTTEPQI